MANHVTSCSGNHVRRVMGGMAFQPFVVGKYQAVELLGEGASGAVYLGRVEGT